MPRLPVYVDSPLAVETTEIFRRHEECYDAETRELLLRDGDVFGFRLIRYIQDVEESKALNGQPGPSIIISPSGMCEAGRILHHLRNNIEDPRNLILIVGFPGREHAGAPARREEREGPDLRRGIRPASRGRGDGRFQRPRRSRRAPRMDRFGTAARPDIRHPRQRGGEAPPWRPRCRRGDSGASSAPPSVRSSNCEGRWT